MDSDHPMRTADACRSDPEQVRALLEAVVASSFDPVVAIDADFTVIACNEAYRKQFGTVAGRTVAIGDSILDPLPCPPPDRAGVATDWARVLAGDGFTVETELGEQSGTRRIYHMTFTPVRIRNGKVIGAVQTAREVIAPHGVPQVSRVTGNQSGDEADERSRHLEEANRSLLDEVEERRRTQELFRQTEDRLWHIIGSADVPMMAHAEDGEILAVSNGLLQSTGYSRERLKHVWDWLELAYGDRAKQVEQIIRTHFASDRPVRGLQQVVHAAAGPRTWIFSSTPPQRLTDGRKYYLVTADDVTERHKAEAALRESEQRARKQLHELEALYRVAPIGLSLLDRDLRFIRISETLAAVDGCSAASHVGRSVRDVLPGLADILEPPMRRVIETGEPLYDWEIKGGAPSMPEMDRYWLVSYFPLMDEGGHVWALGCVVRDVTERKQAEEQRELLLAEVAHRVKNTLATVQSIAMQTLLDGKDLRESRDQFLGRLFALSDVHNVLAECDWRGAELSRVICGALEPFVGMDGSRGVIDGGQLLLKPRAALTLALIIHELATNAAKYGALAAAEGRVDVRWHVAPAPGDTDSGPGDGERLIITWSESDGPAVRSPSRPGFGRTMIERGLAHDLDGVATLAFNPEGLQCSLEVPLARAVETS